MGEEVTLYAIAGLKIDLWLGWVVLVALAKIMTVLVHSSKEFGFTERVGQDVGVPR